MIIALSEEDKDPLLINRIVPARVKAAIGRHIEQHGDLPKQIEVEEILIPLVRQAIQSMQLGPLIDVQKLE